MTTTYTIRGVTTSDITVDYSNGTTATLPIRQRDSRLAILSRIAAYSGTSEGAFADVSDVPFAEGETAPVPLSSELEDLLTSEIENELLTYADLRRLEYPALGDQLDALDWARQGAGEQTVAIDQKIQDVKAKFPKDMAPITRAEYRDTYAPQS